ncbi:sigma factor-like helix-turn-helix DNA-binding protein [Caloranaerobacter azorensis]|uniref:sigma factor-like helix-turn-helix DNA-binding protein n=1 Tax=Caloranaerobacter azorensis TaxID=116090 RepID=UPI00068ED65E|nr:sigma factor-like helix-turn-helix DNA-binding protein [Caloranaerobacter azorensis]
MNYYKATEKFLYNYKPLKISIKNMESELEELEPIGVSAINYENEKTGITYKINKIVENEAIDLISKKELLKDRIEKTKRLVNRIERALETLNDSERKVIEKRYFEAKQWFEIAYEVKYSERWCRDIRKRAIDKLQVSLFGVTSVLLPLLDSQKNIL